MTGIAGLRGSVTTLPQLICAVNYSARTALGGEQVPIVGIGVDELGDEPAGRHHAAALAADAVEQLPDEQCAQPFATPARIHLSMRQHDAVTRDGVVGKSDDFVAVDQLEPRSCLVVTELHGERVPGAVRWRNDQT